MRKIILVLFILTLCSCSSTDINTNIPIISIPESSVEVPSLPTSNPNDIGGDNLQSDWEW